MDKRNQFKEPDLQLDRIVFFSDAVVAIAITLLVLDLKLDIPKPRSVQWSNFAGLYPKFAAYVLSFVLIALFWIVHNQFFRHIKRMNEPLAWLNILYFLSDTIEKTMVRNYQVYCNVGIVNGLVALVFAFFTPVIAFFILFTRPVMMAFYQRWTVRSRMHH